MVQRLRIRIIGVNGTQIDSKIKMNEINKSNALTYLTHDVGAVLYKQSGQHGEAKKFVVKVAWDRGSFCCY
jgi:hypothetical protein